MNRNSMIKTLFATTLFAFVSCDAAFLDLKRDKSQVIPSTVADFVALLDNYAVLNIGAGVLSGTLANDEYYLTDNEWPLLAYDWEKNSYIWADDIFGFEESADWNTAYRRVLYANIVLEGLGKIAPGLETQDGYNLANGGALFHRGLAFLYLAQQFAQSPENESYGRLGIPLRLQSDPTIPTTRATVSETYRQIIDDLETSAQLLPEVSVSFFRPSKAAAYAALSRVYLQLQDVVKADEYAKQALQIQGGELLDYNEMDGGVFYPFPYEGESNPEIIFYDAGNVASFFHRINVDTVLYSYYTDKDLRKDLFFTLDENGTIGYRGSYLGYNIFFSGLAADELYLTRAECLVRKGHIDEGLTLLNLLMEKRYEQGFAPIWEGLDAADAMSLILKERRKQLLFRGVRWFDLRRLNALGGWEAVLSRKLLNAEYTLLPQDLRYTFPIPHSTVSKSKVEQNPR